MARVVVLGHVESIEDAVSHRQILLSAAVWQPSGSPQNARLLDHFGIFELFASQIELLCGVNEARCSWTWRLTI